MEAADAHPARPPAQGEEKAVSPHSPGTLRRSLPWLALLVTLAARPAPAAEFHYVLIFASQRPSGCPKYSHTFATFVKATGEGPAAAAYRLEAHTLSWVPRSLDIRVAALLPEPGANVGLAETFRWARATGQRVSLWGPFRITAGLYYRGLSQIALLESGRVCYQAVDSGRPTDRVSNCIHAVASVLEGYRPRLLVPGWGEVASGAIAHDFARRAALDGGCTHDWVATRLGLDGQVIRCRRG
jgi:hypothetical protein